MRRESQPALPPTWVMLLGSVLIMFHLSCALITALGASSGPWPVQGETYEGIPPRFTRTPKDLIADNYQRLLKATYHFHFGSIKQEVQEISFDAILRDDKGAVVGKRVFPDPEASSAIRYRQQMLAQKLSDDIPLPPQTGIVIAPAGQTLPTLQWWSPDGERRSVLKQDNPNAVPRNQNLMQPSTWQYLVAKSYERYLKRQTSQPKIEIIRTWYNPVMPVFMIDERMSPSPEMLFRYQSSYGELSK